MLAINDHALMLGMPQRAALNLLMAPCVGMALFLARWPLTGSEQQLSVHLGVQLSVQLSVQLTCSEQQVVGEQQIASSK